MALRAAGVSFEQIGAELGVSRQAAWKAVARALDRTAVAISDEAARLRALQLERIETGIRGLWPSYAAGEYGAVDRMCKLLERQAKLTGIDLRPPDVELNLEQQVIVLPAWGEARPQTVDGEATEASALPAPVHDVVAEPVLDVARPVLAGATRLERENGYGPGELPRRQRWALADGEW